jgi:deoxyadenosine/deoxycytidine kinase
MKPDALIGVVGPCGAGKSSLVAGLRARGFRAKPIAQEHSYAPSMWQKITAPDILIFLEVSYPHTISRRKLDWTPVEYEIQLTRLSHAREHANLVVQTDELSIPEVLNVVISFLASFDN